MGGAGRLAGPAIIARLAVGTALAYGFDWAYDKWGRDKVKDVGDAVTGFFEVLNQHCPKGRISEWTTTRSER